MSYRASLRHSFTTRFASTFIPARMYAKNDATYHDLHEVLAQDADEMFFDGVNVETSDETQPEFMFDP